MAQYTTGSVAVTNLSNVVTGSGTKWLSEANVGNLFTVVGINLWYEISSVVSDTEITLSTAYTGASGSALTYAVTRDFTPVFSIPLPAQRDIELASLMRRALTKVEQVLNNAGAFDAPNTVPTGGTGVQTFTSGGLIVGSGVAALRSTTALTTGSIIIGEGDGEVPSVLEAGADGEVLCMVDGKPAWTAISFDTTNFYTKSQVDTALSDKLDAEGVDDRVATLLQPGSNISMAYNDATGQLVISSTGGGGGSGGVFDYGSITEPATLTQDWGTL